MFADGLTDEFTALPTTDPITSGKKYLADRGIPEAVLSNLNGHMRFDHVYVGGKRQDAVGFAYVSQSQPAVKWRATQEKSFIQSGGACRHLWLQDLYKPGNRVLICEGEMDALAWLAAGLPGDVTVMSVPGGAPAKVMDKEPDNQNDTKFRFVWEAREILENAPAIYINTDNDEPGRAMQEELLRRISNPNCFIVHLNGHKDAADTLQAEGPEALRRYFDVASAPPMRGIYRASDYMEEILHRHRHGDPKTDKTGLASVDAYTSFAMGMVTVVTGVPGSGKSNFVDQVFVNMGLEHGHKSLMVQMEKQPRRHIPELVQKIKGQRWRDLSEEELTSAVEWIDKHMFFLDRSDKLSPDTIEGILAEASKLVQREGIRLVSIDPYNYLSRPHSVSETEYVAFMMKTLTDWAKQHDCHVVLVAHPAKPMDRKVIDQSPPTGYDVSGSAHFFNVTDMGLTMHRTKDNENFLHVWKVRFSELGKLGRVQIGFNKDLETWYDLPSWATQNHMALGLTFPPLDPVINPGPDTN